MGQEERGAAEQAKHTPGPWVVWNDREDDGATIANEDGRKLARVNADTISEDLDETLSPEGKANARLIAAAPEMFAALQKVPRRHDRRRRALRALYDNGDLRDEAACDCWVADVRAAVAKAVSK